MGPLDRPSRLYLGEQNRWPHTPTPHPCRECEFNLALVPPSNMLVCDNPLCDAEPLFLIHSV